MEAQPTQAEPTGAEATEVGLPEAGPTEAQSTGEPTEMAPTEAEPTAGPLTEMAPSEAQQTEVAPTGTQPTEAEPDDATSVCLKAPSPSAANHLVAPLITRVEPDPAVFSSKRGAAADPAVSARHPSAIIPSQPPCRLPMCPPLRQTMEPSAPQLDSVPPLTSPSASAPIRHHPESASLPPAHMCPPLRRQWNRQPPS